MAKVKSAERTLRFLEFLASRRDGVSFMEIQEGLGIPKSSAHSLIQEFLESRYLMYDDASKKYYAGLAFIKLCAVCIDSTDFLQELGLLTSGLGREIGRVAVHAGILDGRSIMYLAKYESESNLSLMHNVGLKIPAHCTAIGKVLLSQYTNEQIASLYADGAFEKLTERSIDSIDRLISELERVRADGYATEIREASVYAGCIAMPIYQKDAMLAAFSVTYPSYTLETTNLDDILAVMRKHKDMAEHRLFAL